MKHIHTYDSFLNEARAVRVNLTPDMFKDDTTWGLYKNTKNTGNSTWVLHSVYFVDMVKGEGFSDEKNVVKIECSCFDDGTCYAYVGLINNVSRDSGSNYGKPFAFTSEDATSNIKKLSNEAAKFLMDNDHFKWINQNIKAEGNPLTVVPKGDFAPVFAKVIMAAINDKK
jgi:hypothetical protein